MDQLNQLNLVEDVSEQSHPWWWYALFIAGLLIGDWIMEHIPFEPPDILGPFQWNDDERDN
jgi:hypothetical protein